jgi:hypothetical protein
MTKKKPMPKKPMGYQKGGMAKPKPCKAGASYKG